jgi:hypothetical protein
MNLKLFQIFPFSLKYQQRKSYKKEKRKKEDKEEKTEKERKGRKKRRGRNEGGNDRSRKGHVWFKFKLQTTILFHCRREILNSFLRE